ncbi:MAG: DinB family protein [Candidatus Heimdallarchaeota archaeon]|nr:DinB family protein [Candidatus Heimdallarchaeota archaeon]MCG3253220.1 DinB family protein [Candidatus Heimdallarchaeota archaeon]MCK4290357.1 DinB family protein [Candidatus Heimdallarchaeota archaeon]
MNSRNFLAKQLGETAQIIDWAINLVPEDRLLEIPPHSTHPKADESLQRYFGLWSAYRLMFHLVHYEENWALPGLKNWLGEIIPAKKDIPNEKEMWDKELVKGVDLKLLLKRFHSVREKQIEALSKMSDNLWKEKKTDTYWGEATAEFTVSKTIQHTLEHGNKLTRMAIHWDRLLEYLDLLRTDAD